MKLPERPYLNIVGHKYIWFSISAVIFIVSVIALITQGLNFGIDFTGGTEITIKTENGATIEKVRSVTGDFGYGDANIQVSVQRTFKIRVPELSDAQSAKLVKALDQEVKLARGSNGKVVADIKDVGPGWGARVSRQALIALAVFILAILIYISFRFEFKMAMTAVIEILHDFVIVIGVYALVGFEVTPATVIAVLTILGYSLYDTIVIFDRVKENTDQLTRQSKKTYSDTVNDSVNQVLVRSINTSLTTLIPIVAILFFGGETLRAFALPLFLGVLSGTYSSIILAPPVLSMMKETEPKYRTYREHVERGKAGAAPQKASAGAGVAAKKKPGGVKGAGAGAAKGAGKKQAAAGSKAAQKAAPAPKPKEPPKPEPEAGGAADAPPVEAGAEGQAPKPKPKPKPAAGKAVQPTSKSKAKSRTKGPGGGKKKKKKR